MVLCLSCRRFEPPRADLEHFRTSAGPYCSACGSSCVLDLRDEDAATQLDAADEPDRAARQRDRRIWARMRALGALSLLTMACVPLWGLCVSLVQTANAAPFLGAQEESRYTMAIFLGTAAVVLSLVLVGRARRLGQIWTHTRVPATPERWSMVPPVAKPSRHPIAAGSARATDLLTAPLSGRPCVAYEIGVRTDGQVDGPWGSWIILEQHHAPDLTIGSWMARGCAVHLDLDRGPAQPKAIDSDRARNYFRERGLPSTIGYRIFETILRPSQTATVHDARHPTKQAAVLRSTG